MNSEATSFIPQRPVGNKLKNRGVRKIYVLAYVSYVVFFGSVLAAGLVYFYQFTVNKELDVQRTALASEKSKFSESDIVSVREMEKRLNLAKDRMDKHISVLSIFGALENSAVQSIQYTSFEYKRPNDAAPIVTFSGNTDKFDNLMFQREVLQANPILSGAMFSDVGLSTVQQKDSTGAVINGTSKQVVSFTLNTEVPTSLVGYSALNAASAPQKSTTITTQASQQSIVNQGTATTSTASTSAPASNQ